jgi:hypothetical protein
MTRKIQETRHPPRKRKQQKKALPVQSFKIVELVFD